MNPAPASQPPEQRQAHWRLALVLFLVLVALYNANLRFGTSGDTLAVRYVPFSLLADHSLYVDRWVQPYLTGPFKNGGYFLNRSRGHWMSSYPVLTPVLVTPLYPLPLWWLSRQPAELQPDATYLLAGTMEKVSASLIAAASAVFVLLALLRLLPTFPALLLTLVYALASGTWSTSSQSLWMHGTTELSFGMLLWALLRDRSVPADAFFIGLALALAVANRPSNAAVAVPVLIYFFLQERRSLPFLLLPIAALGCLVLAYNLWFFGKVAGAYMDAMRAATFWDVLARGSWKGFPGLLVSPNRGLLVFTPWVAFAFWGAARLWRGSSFAWARYVIAGCVADFAVHALYFHWWGGWSFGPRYLTDLLPFLAFFTAAVWPDIRRATALRAVFAVTVAFSLWVQVVGAFCYTWQWDSYPAEVDTHSERIWDWRDTQILRNWRAGPAPPDLYLGWQEYFENRTALSALPQLLTRPRR